MSDGPVKWWRDKDVFVAPIDQFGFYTRKDHDERSAPLVDRYLERWKAGSEPPPLVVIPNELYRQPHYSVLDGYHRLHAAHLLGVAELRAVKAWDALHGLFETIERLASRGEG